MGSGSWALFPSAVDPMTIEQALNKETAFIEKDLSKATLFLVLGDRDLRGKYLSPLETTLVKSLSLDFKPHKYGGGLINVYPYLEDSLEETISTIKNQIESSFNKKQLNELIRIYWLNRFKNKNTIKRFSSFNIETPYLVENIGVLCTPEEWKSSIVSNYVQKYLARKIGIFAISYLSHKIL